MTKCIYKSDLGLFKIDDANKVNFIAKCWSDISDFQDFALRLVGDVLRPQGSQEFWNDGCYSWYVDSRQSHEQRVWMTDNGIAMFEDCQTDELFRIEFHY